MLSDLTSIILFVLWAWQLLNEPKPLRTGAAKHSAADRRAVREEERGGLNGRRRDGFGGDFLAALGFGPGAFVFARPWGRSAIEV